MQKRLVGTLTFAIVYSLAIFTTSQLQAENQIQSPRMQVASGIDPEKVTCKSDLVLMIRFTNDSAACVKPSTSTILEQRGWGTIFESKIGEENPAKVELQEKLTIETEKSDSEGESEKEVTIEEQISAGSEQEASEEP